MSDTGAEKNSQDSYKDLPEIQPAIEWDYSCEYCGVKLTTTFALLMPLRCIDHGVIMTASKASIAK